MLPRSPATQLLSASPSSPSSLLNPNPGTSSSSGGVREGAHGSLGQGLASSSLGEMHIEHDQMARSPSAISSLSSSSIPPHPGLLRRRSTDTSGGLDYYWSSLAGAGASSSSSSLASPASGPLLSLSISPSSIPSLKNMDGLRTARSHGNIGASARNDEFQLMPQHSRPAMVWPDRLDAAEPAEQEQTEKTPRISDSRAGPSTRPPHLDYPSQTLSIPSQASDAAAAAPPEDRSPGGWSATSDYSDSTSAPVSAGPQPSRPSFAHRQSDDSDQFEIDSDAFPSRSDSASDSVSSHSAYSPLDYRRGLDSDSFEGEVRRALLDPSTQAATSESASGQDWDVRDSMNSGSTYMPEAAEVDETLHRTPIAPAYNNDRPDLRLPYPHLNFSPNLHGNPSPTSSGHGSDPTPTSAVKPKTASTPSHYTPSTAGPALSAFGLADPASGSGTPSPSYTPDRSTREPRSAPAAKSDFGEIGLGADTEDDQEDTLKGKKKKRRTLPATTSNSSTLSIDTENLLSPDKYASGGNGTPIGGKGKGDVGRSPSPGRSPEPPPRSALRAQYIAQLDTEQSGTSSPVSMTPDSNKQPLPLPTIINTTYSPGPSPDKNKPQPPRPDRSPDRQYSPIFPSSATINDLTDMLGGAIDAIGLIDSRETPPPTIGEPSKREKPNMSLSLGPLAPAAEVNDRGPITPTSLPMRGTSLPGTTPTHPTSSAPFRQHTQPQPDLSRKTSSILSTTSSNQIVMQSPTISISARPWPSAMLYGHIKSLKHAGDRAKGYAKAINELARSETGLREWCAASAAQAHRPVRVVAAPSKMAAAASLGVRSTSIPLHPSHALSPYDPSPTSAPHMRNVSASSEFPMRADSYAAREISQRVMDPSDQPTALPPNLPYPQLQQQQHLNAFGSGGGGLKPSQSMQSVASFASTKKGFFSAIGRKGSAKKDSISLGPPNGLNGMGINMGNGNNSNGSASKKDVRGLPISAPRSTSPSKIVETGLAGPGGSLQAPRVQASISAPLGPRGPRMGSFTPPPPSSTGLVDRALTEVPAGRASLDTGLSRLAPENTRGRASLDHTHTPISSVPSPSPSGSGSPYAGRQAQYGAAAAGSPSAAMVKENDQVRQMADILPHAGRSVLRSYLRRYGDPMQAIGAYLEDEKNGSVVR